MRASRKLVIFGAILSAALCWPGRVDAEAESVPIVVQVELLARIASYDRKLAERSAGRVRVAIVIKPGNLESEHSSLQLRNTLGATPSIGGLPHEEVVFKYSNADALAAACRSERISIIYFTPGFTDELPAIRAALDGVSVLSVSTMPAYVPGGVVLGFDLVSGKPKLLFHLTQARRQNVSLSPEIIHLMRIYE